MGWSVGKSRLYTKFLKPNGIDYKNYNSKGWEPDECFINETNRTAYIIEKSSRSQVVRWMKSYQVVISRN